jgi:Zn-dependent M28 family amino/carboxypeptidase
MKYFICTGLFIMTILFSKAQNIDEYINAAEAERIEKTLSSDDMMGRKTFTPGIDKAAAFIAKEFEAAGLKPLPGSKGFLQEFTLVRPKLISMNMMNGETPVNNAQVVVVTSKPQLHITQASGYEIVAIKEGDNFSKAAQAFAKAGKNLVVQVSPVFEKNFARLNGLARSLFKSDYSVVFVLGNIDAMKFQVDARYDISELKLANVVGMLPGKKKKEEYVVFSGHYDHLGTSTKGVNGDTIYNGANDDAAGTAAVIMLGHWLAAAKSNERSVIFAAFTAEEIGGYGSQYFSQQLDAEKVTAMFNIEMIGTESKWGTNSAYITGYEKTNMGSIMQANLEGTGFTFYPDPYPAQQLFYRSDNATLARLGVPAHTISTSKMDSEKYYHTVDDEIETLDMANMAQIVKAIALSSRSMIAGTDSPIRVNTGDLK